MIVGARQDIPGSRLPLSFVNNQYFKIQKMVANTCNHRTGKGEARLS